MNKPELVKQLDKMERAYERAMIISGVIVLLLLIITVIQYDKIESLKEQIRQDETIDANTYDT